MENQFDLGLNIASIETELPDPVITLTGADRLTALETAEMPLLALTVYGRSWLENGAIHSVGDGQSQKITSCGKNIFDFSAWVNGVSSVNGGTASYGEDSLTLSTTAEQTNCYVNATQYKIPVESNMTYTLSWTASSDIKGENFVFFNGDYTRYAKANNQYNKKITFVTESDVTYVTIRFSLSGAKSSVIYTNMQLEEGGNATSYVHYSEPAHAEITTALPLKGVPVSNNGNYTDGSGQEWICDTVDHVYGKPAKVTRRIGLSSLVHKFDMRGGNALLRWVGADYTIQYVGEYGEMIWANSRWNMYLHGWSRIIQYDTDGNITTDVPPDRTELSLDLSNVIDSGYEFVGDWRNADGTAFENENVVGMYKLADGGELPEDYICATGVPTLGAEVIYPAEAETILLTTKETEQLNALSGYIGSTTVYNNNTAEMTVKLLREDYEMQYIYWIKESQSFVCEKSGKYKIICVGGGASGGLAAAGRGDCLQAVGSTTSFGNIISASGGGHSKGSTLSNIEYGASTMAGGQSGYDGINYASTAFVTNGDWYLTGGESAFMWGTGHGYGAGGGAHGCSIDSNHIYTAAAGACGKVESTIVDLEENQSVFCTVGGGGVLKLSDSDVTEYLGSTASSGDGEKLSACVSNGADGVIIVQYLGL